MTHPVVLTLFTSGNCNRTNTRGANNASTSGTNTVSTSGNCIITHCRWPVAADGGGANVRSPPPPVTENIPRIYCTLNTMVYGVHYFDYYSIQGYMKPAIWEL